VILTLPSASFSESELFAKTPAEAKAQAGLSVVPAAL